MTIKQEYRRVRANYLARVRELETQGYQVDRVAIPKKPTLGSINRLQSLTTKTLKEKSTLVDISTGEVVNQKELTASTRKNIQKKNKKLHNYAKDIQKSIGVKGRSRKSIRELLIENIPTVDEISLENFMESIDQFIPPVQEFIRQRVAELASTEENKKAFIKAIRDNPDYLPIPTDSDIGIISYKFAQLARIMDLDLQSNEMQEFIEMSTVDVELEE